MSIVYILMAEFLCIFYLVKAKKETDQKLKINKIHYNKSWLIRANKI